MLYVLIGLSALFFSPVNAAQSSQIMFEGYYSIKADGAPIGYSIQRYEFDNKSKTFLNTTFMRLKMGEKVIQESLKAKANNKLQPISYQYTSQIDDQLKAIDASFSGQIMKLKISDGKKVREETHKIPKDTFLSSFLVYVMLQKKLPLNQAFKYSGVAEEEGASYWGKAWLKSKETKGKLTVFTVLNSFKGDEFKSQLAAVPHPDPNEKDKYVKGEVLSTEFPKNKITTELVASPNLATEGQVLPNKTLTMLFSGIPAGKVNLVATPVDKE